MKRFLSLFLSALMVLSCLTALTVFAADAPAIDGQYLLMTADAGNGLSQSDANALKGSDGFTYTEDLEITSVNSGAYFGIWIGKGNGYIAGYNANTEELMIAKRKLGTVGGFDTANVLGKGTFTLEKNTAYRISVAVSGTKAEILVNGEVKLAVDDSNIGTPQTLIVYHYGMNAKIDNTSLANAAGTSLASLSFASKDDFAANGWKYTVDAGYSIPGVIEKPKPIDGEYMMKVEYGTNYMASNVIPYDYAGFTYEFDICPLDTYTEDENNPTFAGVYFGGFDRIVRYNFTLQQFEIGKGNMPTGNGEVYHSVPYKWEDYTATDEYNWHKLGFRMVMGKMIVFVDGEPVLEYENESLIYTSTDKVIIGYTNGEFYMDNIKLARTFSYDCATGKGDVLCSDDFNSGMLSSYNANWTAVTAGNCLLEQATDQTVCTSADKYSDTPSPDPEIDHTKNVLYSSLNAKYIDSANFTAANGSYTTAIDVAFIEPRSENDAYFGFWFGKDSKVYAGYDLSTKTFVVAKWLSEADGYDRDNVYMRSETVEIVPGEWNTLGFRVIGSSAALCFDGEILLEGSNTDFETKADYPVKFYTLAKLYLDNWVLADAGYNMVENTGKVVYKVAFDADNFDGKLSGIEEGMVNYDIVAAKCKGMGEDALYDCNLKLYATGEGYKSYCCDCCGNIVTYDDQGNLIDNPKAGIAGDANGDGKVNLKDASAIIRKSASWDVDPFYEDLANVNTDTVVNLKDASAIIRYYAQWDVELVYNGKSADAEISYNDPVITSTSSEYVSKLGVAFTPVNLKRATYGLKFDVAENEYLQYFSVVDAPSWGNSLGGLNVSIYKWDTDYATTISSAPLYSSDAVDFADNSTHSFAVNSASDIFSITNGTYLAVIKGIPSADGSTDDVGIWTAGFEKSTRNFEGFKDGVSTADYAAKSSLSFAFAG